MEEGQTTQWPTEKGQEKFEDTKEVIRSHRWKKDRQHNGQNKNDKKRLKMSKR